MILSAVTVRRARLRFRIAGTAGLLGPAAGFLFLFALGASASPLQWRAEWPNTDFTKTAVDFREIRSGGPPKDGIPSIDRPIFVPVKEYRTGVDTEPVIAFSRNGDARAYPLRVLIWHEIVNDTVGDLPVAVTYCPLCNSAVVFERRVAGRTLSFGTTGKLRHSDMVMYDRQTESWWQQFSGTGIVGEMTGASLRMLPVRVESLARFRERFPDGKVLVPADPNMRPYGSNPYVGYDTARLPFLYDGDMPEGIAPMAYVVVVGNEAWPLDTVKREGLLRVGDLEIEWTPGQVSVLDSASIQDGRDIGNIAVRRLSADGPVDEVHDVTFAFVFHAFSRGGTLHD